jgi:hypothetical protein
MTILNFVSRSLGELCCASQLLLSFLLPAPDLSRNRRCKVVLHIDGIRVYQDLAWLGRILINASPLHLTWILF